MTETRLFKVTNKAPGPRQVLTRNGGVTIEPGQSKNVELTESDWKAMKPYRDIGHLQFAEPDEEEQSDELQFDLGKQITPATLTPVTERPEPQNPIEQIIPNDEPEHDDEELPPEIDDEKAVVVKHLGFGRWYGLSDADNKESRVTEAMTGAEAEAYAAEHGIPKGNLPDPSDEGEAEVDTEATELEQNAPADETVADEHAGDTEEQQ